MSPKREILKWEKSPHSLADQRAEPTPEQNATFRLLRAQQNVALNQIVQSRR
jgi:hypothetical protein